METEDNNTIGSDVFLILTGITIALAISIPLTHLSWWLLFIPYGAGFIAALLNELVLQPMGRIIDRKVSHGDK